MRLKLPAIPTDLSRGEVPIVEDPGWYDGHTVVVAGGTVVLPRVVAKSSSCMLGVGG